LRLPLPHARLCVLGVHIDDQATSGGAGTDALPQDAAAPRLHYRPQLDGLRAVAVYLVVAYHAGLHAFSGGFVGVDVFFVLSGYLVTALLLRDIRATGRIDLRRFYARRFRRLLPAAFVTLIVTAIVYTAVAAPADVNSALGGFRSAFLYVANWHFIRQSNDYFAANVNTNPVVHFWSLAVEEQFYLAWPLLLSAAYFLSGRAGDRRWKVLRLIILVGAVISLVSALHLSTVNVSRAYYGTDTRAYELLAGALLAVTPRAFVAARRHRRAVQTLAPPVLAVLVLIGTSVIHLGQIQRGVAATVATCGAIVALEVSRAGWAKGTLSSPTAVYLGRVSYGTYLWHWPVIVIVLQRYHPNPISLFALTCLIGTGLASLSYEVVEQRVRVSSFLDQHRTGVIAVGLAASLIGGLVLVPAILRHDRSAAAVSAATLHQVASRRDTRVAVPQNLELDKIGAESYYRPNCYHRPVARCIIVHGKGPRVLLIGDSHAESFIPGFAAIAQKYSLTLAIVTTQNCPWQDGLVEVPDGAAPNLTQVCRAHQAEWYERVVPKFDPDIVVLIHRPIDDTTTPNRVRLPDNEIVLANRKASEAALRSVTNHTLDELRKAGRKIVIVEPLPLAPSTFNPLTCLSQAEYLDGCRYVATARPSRIEQYYRSLANGTDLYTLDLDRLVCPYLPICDPIVDGIVVKKDSQHITRDYSRHVADSLAALLVADGIITAPR
jgi:peptidoglycan/LPS O-acetylase OafA/YrhL